MEADFAASSRVQAAAMRVAHAFEEFSSGGANILEGEDDIDVTGEEADVRAEVCVRLRGKHLACHCSPRPCHAEILAALANDTSATLAALLSFRRQCEP